MIGIGSHQMILTYRPTAIDFLCTSIDRLICQKSIKGDYISFTDYESLNKLRELGLYTSKNERDFPEYIINSSMTEEPFLIEYKWIMGDNSWSGFYTLEPVILSIQLI